MAEPLALGTVAAPPAQVRARLAAACFVVGSMWFPTLAELRDWRTSTTTLYVRFTGPASGEVGPRLYSLQAARFAPVLSLRLVPEGIDRTRLVGEVRASSAMRALVLGWGGTLVVWPVLALLSAESADLRWVPWWAVLVAFVGFAALAGHVMGGRALRAALPELVRIAGDADAGTDDF